MYDVGDVYEFPTDTPDLITSGVKGIWLYQGDGSGINGSVDQERFFFPSALLKLSSIVMSVPSQPPKINELSLKDLFWV